MIVKMNSFGSVPISENIKTENIFGCRVVLMKTATENIIYHIRADNQTLEKQLIAFCGTHKIKKCVQLLPVSVGAFELHPLPIKSKVVRYSPKVLSLSNEVVDFSKLLNIPISELNKEKSANYVGIFGTKFTFHNLKIN